MKLNSSSSLLGALTAALIAVTSVTASANSLTITRSFGYFSGGGGEFTVNSNDTELLNIRNLYSPNAILNGGIQTFCLEESEFISDPGTYPYAINPVGALSAGGVVDPLSIGAADLYFRFATGALVGYDYTPGAGRSASAGLLQQAIWWLEDEVTVDDPSSNVFLQEILNKYGNGAKSDNNGAFLVGAINMGKNGEYQDQIVLIPDGGMTIALFGGALIALGLIRRRLA